MRINLFISIVILDIVKREIDIEILMIFFLDNATLGDIKNKYNKISNIFISIFNLSTPPIKASDEKKSRDNSFALSQTFMFET